MPAPLYTQSVIAFIWDFDKTLTHGYMQEPLFDAYGVDAKEFWDEVNGLKKYYSERGLQVSQDSVYLDHMLTYVQNGVFEGLTNQRLRELGANIQLAPGLPDFFEHTREAIRSDPRYASHEVKVEHYVVSTGLRQMIEGSPLAQHVDGVWACELLSDPPGPGYLREPPPQTAEGVVSQIGYVIDNTSKTRAIFEINKGVNVDSKTEVNTKIPEDERRVPIRNMIYVADGPSDVPSFSVVNLNGGKTFGVYTPDSDEHYDKVADLQDQGRVNSIAAADYRLDQPAAKWLLRALKSIANEICDAREKISAARPGAPSHTV